MGATELEALQGMADLGADIRVSYDHRRTRLHAKAWLFQRDTGFGTALIGSSNLSKAALRDGCEWNVRLSQRDNPGLVAKCQNTFEQYWDDAGFEPFDAARFRQTLGVRHDAARDALVRISRLRALPHQQSVLDALEAERASGHHRNLVVAATGTGKTVVAALDYARQPGRPSLLFVAHRDHILEQSLATFRVAVRDGSFGEKLTGRDKPILGTHVFASVQSLHADRLAQLDPEAYDVVVVDEFHHAAAPTYEALLRHLRPKLLLGLTATPERPDGKSVLGWFGGRVAAESRLWDALDNQLLTPFQYFGLHDATDLSQVDFRAGRYDPRSLEALYTADEHRARQVLRALTERVRRPHQMKALGFCVTVKHAEYMRDTFVRHGLPAAVVEGRMSPAERDQVVARLRSGSLCCVFTVDVFNEGVDLPFVDTVLFLRPTESATVFLQQLGRGLRLHPDKGVLTVLDFVGNAHRDFRFDLRFRAMLGGGTRAELRQAVEEGFPSLPSGCSIQLEARAQAAVLANLKRTLRRWPALADDLDPGMGVADFLRRADLDVVDLYRSTKSFVELRARKGLLSEVPHSRLVRVLCRLTHVDDPMRLRSWQRLLSSEKAPEGDWGDAGQRSLFAALAERNQAVASVGTLWADLWGEPLVLDELRQLVDVLLDRSRRRERPVAGLPLALHARYARAELSALLDLVTDTGKLLIPQTGVYQCKRHRCDLLFVTLDKDEKHFTPTTLYEDFPISPTRFHWESQSVTREDSPTGQRYRSPPNGWQTLLFVRQKRYDTRGMTSPFLCLGPVRYLRHEGERPMRITWGLEEAMPGDWFQRVKIAGG